MLLRWHEVGVREWANNYCHALWSEIMGDYNTRDTTVEIGA